MGIEGEVILLPVEAVWVKKGNALIRLDVLEDYTSGLCGIDVLLHIKN